MRPISQQEAESLLGSSRISLVKTNEISISEAGEDTLPESSSLITYIDTLEVIKAG